jgi:hypothetical protein
MLWAGQPAEAVTFFLFDATTASEDHSASYAMDAEGCFPRVTKLEYEAHHLSPFSAELKNAWSFTSTLHICLNGVVLRHRENVTFLNHEIIPGIKNYFSQIYLKTKQKLISSTLIRK